MENDQFTDNPNMLPTLPTEIWSMVLDNLTSNSESILTCRKVSTEFMTEIDKKMKWFKHPELDPLTEDDKLTKPLYPTQINDVKSIMDFHSQMEKHEDNPFPTRTLSLNPLHPRLCRCRSVCVCPQSLKDNLLFVVCHFCNRYGHDVYRLGYNLENRDALRHLNLLQYFPNLRQLELRIVGGCCPMSTSESEQSFGQLLNFNFPPFPHLTSLKVHVFEVKGNNLMTKVLTAYGRQLKRLSLAIHVAPKVTPPSTTNFGNLRSEDTPNLTNLSVRFMPECGQQHILNCVKNGNWPLKQLSLYEVKSDFLANQRLLDDVMQILSKYAATLEIVHFFFPQWSRFMLKLGSLSHKTPEQVATELQLNVKLPLVREFSVIYSTDEREFSGTIKLLERFVNLETIHFALKTKPRFKCGEYVMSDHEEELRTRWWPVLSPACKIEKVIIFSGNKFDDNAFIHKVIKKPSD